MNGKDSTETNQKKFAFLSNVFYYIVILALVLSIVFMYRVWNQRRQQYAQLVKEASVQDQGYAIEFQKKHETTDESKEQSPDDAIPEISDQPDQ